MELQVPRKTFTHEFKSLKKHVKLAKKHNKFLTEYERKSIHKTIRPQDFEKDV